MVKKLKAMANKSRTESQLAAAVKDSAQEIWLAGLGAFAKAQEEGQKVFKALVREGASIQQRTMKVTEDRVNDVTAKVTKVAAGLQKQANGTWDKLETVFEARVERALTRLGVPTNKEITSLTKRVEALAKEWKPDVLHAHSPVLDGLAALRVGKALGIPVIYEIRAFWEDAAVGNGTGRAGSVRYRLTRALEDRVGVPLLMRTTRSVGLTQAGADVLAPGAVSARWRLGNGSLLRIDLNLSDRPVVHTPQAGAALLFEHPAQSAGLLDRGTLAPYCALVSLTAAAPLQPPDGERP